jgi:spermidine synthase
MADADTQNTGESIDPDDGDQIVPSDAADGKRVCFERFSALSALSAPISAFGAQINQPLVPPEHVPVVLQAAWSSGESNEPKMNKAPLALLYLNVLIIATCGLIYELLAGTLASYVLGDSITQFSLIIGIYLSALGVGAWLSSFIKKDLARKFIEVELGVALLGGCSAPLLFLSFAKLSWFVPILYSMVFSIGVLVGLELPLLMRILKDHLDFGDLISKVLAVDYIGALVAALLFPIFLVPNLGLVRTSLVFGIFNALVGLWGTSLLRPILPGKLTGLRIRSAVIITILVVGIIKAEWLTTLAEDSAFSQTIVYSQTTPYQRIVVTRTIRGFQLFLNGNMQFNSADEYRYHEALVHPAMSSVSKERRKRILVMGGGDGLAVRELLKYPEVEQITLVDIDPEMTKLSVNFGALAELNNHAFDDKRVEIVNDDAMIWLETIKAKYDVAVIDFPDPNSFALGKLYTTRFYRLLKRSLADDAVIGIQSTSPLLAHRSYWCIVRTMEAAGFHVHPYQAPVPSFGVWGFALAKKHAFDSPDVLPSHVETNMRYLTNDTLRSLFQLPADIRPVDVEINRLDNQALVKYYEGDAKGKPPNGG